MEKDTRANELKIKAEDVLSRIEKVYGFVPLVNQVLSEKPEAFFPFVELNKVAFFAKGELSIKVRELAAISAATALGAEHCLPVHIQMALKYGANRNEILESMIIGSLMCMTKAQSYAFRKYQDAFSEKEELENQP